jgi:hypothetical protein
VTTTIDNPKPVGVASENDQCLNPSELADNLDDLAAPDAEAAAAQEWAKYFDDKPLVINLSARIADERLNCWLEADPRFRETWFRQRADLQDQSQSTYDLALACLGLGAGLTEQEIVDLIVHHRALHKQKQRTRLDYFQRTISQATSRTDGTGELGKAMGAKPGNGGPSSSEDDLSSSATPEADATAKKAALCKTLSGVLGVQIHKITKISGHSPIFHMELAEGTAEFPNVGKLISQTPVRNTLAAITGRLMRKFKPEKWQKVSQALLNACTIEEGGEEMDLEGSARLRLTQYLSVNAFIGSIDGQSPDNARKPMVADGLITVCASDIQTFINRTISEKVTIPAVVGMLSAVGAKTKRFRGKFPEQSRWLLPPDKFAATDYAVSTGQESPDDSQ